jgi:geranylgeranyl pyrophosphate synthase
MMQNDLIEKMLSHHLARSLPHHKVSEVYFYASLPGGKFFRPHLVWSIFQDLNAKAFTASQADMNSNHALLASAVELHHTYTLLHDDLPCMDNDLERRGKPCTHIAFGEWQALLAGDGLLNISYQLLSKVKNSPRSADLFKFFGWALGPKGLIHGQVLDLSHEMTIDFKTLLRTHELKTARLIQVAILGSAVLATNEKNSVKEKKLWNYSRLLGINFQLIDDLSELHTTDLSTHEQDVNPWIHFPEETLSETIKGLKSFEHLSRELGLKNTDKIVSEYYKKMLSIIVPNLENLTKHTNKKLDLAPVILIMKTFGDM